MFAVVTCRDAGDATQARASALPAHREYVDRHASSLMISGPLLGADGSTRVGQLFILDVADVAEAERFIAEDPFTKAGVFTDVQVDGFLPVFRDGARVRAAGPGR